MSRSCICSTEDLDWHVLWIWDSVYTKPSLVWLSSGTRQKVIFNIDSRDINSLHVQSLCLPTTRILLSYPFTTTPPLGCKLWPDIKLLSWLARNTKHVATSLGCPGRPIGVALNCSIAEVVIVAGISGVQTSFCQCWSNYVKPIEPTWSRADTVYTYAILHLLVRKRSGECNDCTLRWCIVKQIGTADVMIDWSAVDDRRSTFQVRKCILWQVEDGMNIRVKCTFPLRSISRNQQQNEKTGNEKL